MKVFKFGGASVKDANAVKNVASILATCNEKIIVVISAMGKTTNALEKVVDAHFHKTGTAFECLNEVKKYHYTIAEELFLNSTHPIFQELHNTFVEVEWILEDDPSSHYDFLYDQIVCIGELLSTKIVSAYLNEVRQTNNWQDVRDFLQTDNTYRFARINWGVTETRGKQILLEKLNQPGKQIIITQGFIGSTSENFVTTLGREGSDFSAAIIAYITNAESVTIWKDVPGVMNADPKKFNDVVLLSNISYREAIELTFFGASVIHPRTLKPLQNKNIPLYVKSFIEPNAPGTVINENTSADSLIPSFIFRENQVLISVSARDYSFIVEDNLSEIFGVLAKQGIKINIMQNSAMNFSFAADFSDFKLKSLIKELENKYEIKYNSVLELLTIRHYNQGTIEKLTQNKQIYLQQKTRSTARFLMQ
ncbi:MAG: aspartate kinase [Bacteroidetes bacterium]|nr:aspartate kinase [Bacteroidota bacterium]MBV6461042.1 Lysine-sensitive aspartokinase 3 [Flavobacteriales bacterium]WKZ75560.1 MAG: aspartate kinase [Vicingaceae bacterium]MCL4815126.1 aspartate kinase [Flavobacteriales bacterium]NOG94468.1 aspartate kinase [Bacteroidota bacterium]